MNMLDAALQYNTRGWSVIPAHTVRADGSCSCPDAACETPGKHPRVTWKAYQESPPSEHQIRRWWTNWPNANIAVITGKVSGIVVIDVDPRHQGDISLAQLGALPDTLTCLTGGGGQHLYWVHPGRIIADGAGSASGLPDGIDVRGDGGYVIAPPSSHVSGGRYAWDVGQPEEPSPMPPVIDQLLRERKIGDVAPSSRRFDLEEILNRRIKGGSRNQTLTAVAGHYAATSMTYDAVLMALRGVNATYCDPPCTDREVVTVVDSIYAKEEAKRRVSDAIAERLAVDGDAKDVVIPDERRAMACKLWDELGIPKVTDWIVIRSDHIEYVIYTADDEARLGDDLLNQGVLRKKLLNELGEILKPVENKIEWPKRAKMLRDLAREEVADSPKAEDRVEEWLEGFLAGKPVIHNPTPEERGDALRKGAVIEEGHLYLKPEVLRQHLDLNVGERMVISDLRKMLKRAGWTPQIVGTEGGTMRAWRHLYANGHHTRAENES